MTQVLLSGLAIGAVYGLVGMGFAIAFYVTRVINFAEGQLLMVGVMVAAWFARTGLNPWAAPVLGIAAAAAVGAVTYLVAVRPVLAFDRFSFAWLVCTLGVALILENGAALIWGPTSRSFPRLLTGTSVHVGGATLTLQEVVTIAVAIAVRPSAATIPIRNPVSTAPSTGQPLPRTNWRERPKASVTRRRSTTITGAATAHTVSR